MLPRLALTFIFTAVLSSAPALAQQQSAVEVGAQPAQFDAPAYIAVVDGGATLERDGRVERSPLNMPVLTGDRLRTADGRVEIQFADGGRLLLDAGTAVDVLADDLVCLTAGRLRLSVMRAQQVSYRVDSPAGSVRIFQPGEYRVALLRAPAASPGAGEETQLEFAVASGAGEISTAQGVTTVRAGERAYASAGLLPSYAYAYNSAAGDDFDRWADMQRGTVYDSGSASAQYLPQDMTTYASTFDQYGDWRYQQSYGYVWYPRVAADWRPYYYGRWAAYPSYGYTWIPSDPFGYPTHHYGRWGFSAGLWFWIPSAAWGPAYVSWAYAPDYVSWCPLGWNNHAVFSVGYYNVGPAYYSSRYHGRYYSAWTTVRHNDFGHGYYAHQRAVNFDRGYAGARPHFAEGRTPAAPAFVNARATAAAPIRNGGTRAAAPRYVNRGNDIVRSQTAQPIPPRDSLGARWGRTSPGSGETAIPRTAPQNYAPGAYSRQRPSTVLPSAPSSAERTAPQQNYGPGAYARQRPSTVPPSAPNAVQERTAPQQNYVPGAYARQRPSTVPPSDPNAVQGRSAPQQNYAAGAYAQPPSTVPPSAPSAVEGRPSRAWDNPAYRPPNYTPPPSRTAPAFPPPNAGYERATPRQEPPPAPHYSRPSAPEPSRPGGGERAAPRPSPGAQGGGHVETRAPSGAGVARRR